MNQSMDIMEKNSFDDIPQQKSKNNPTIPFENISNQAFETSFESVPQVFHLTLMKF